MSTYIAVIGVNTEGIKLQSVRVEDEGNKDEILTEMRRMNNSLESISVSLNKKK